jgi:hypothetical protein
MEYILLECSILQEDIERLIAQIAKTDNWPIKKDLLIKKTLQSICKIHKRDGQNSGN